ncbi:unnamed protein product [Phyllotreta striolata]|uniref:Ensconsin-like n=1 Tax=Phyllotreta striolata TaxID=444603 RepID=A0A9N9TC77_PHYSR|nr:unnamed protein product [Phyllotreta striolata]
MEENKRVILEQSKSSDKDARFRNVKERQNEERHKKLEEIKAQALAAQIFKEQKEQERRRRLDEMRVRHDEKRQQVEERKKAICDAERDRLHFIIKRNQEREQRIESKRRNERSSAVFAFGSSTPRMLDPSDMHVSYWNNRRSTSIQNITTSVDSSSALTRRQSERDLDVGSKKRATSATGLERTGNAPAGVVPAGCASGFIGRRRTDLVPTIPTKDSLSSSHKSLNHSPGRAYSMSRLDQLARPRKRHLMPSLVESGKAGSSYDLSQSRSRSRDPPISRSVSHIAVRKPRPGAELGRADSRSMQQLSTAARPAAQAQQQQQPRTTRTTQLREQKALGSSNCSEASSRPSSSLSQHSTNSLASSISLRHRLNNGPRKPRPASIAVTGVTHDLKGESKPPLPKPKKPAPKPSDKPAANPKPRAKTPVDNGAKPIVKHAATKEKTSSNQKSDVNHLLPNEPKPAVVNGKVECDEDKPNAEAPAPAQDVIPAHEEPLVVEQPVKEVAPIPEKIDPPPQADVEIQKPPADVEIQKPQAEVEIQKPQAKEKPDGQLQVETEADAGGEMSSSMTKSRITTEEEAKAALAERRRLIREEAERQAELERLRVEAEAQAELERQRQEEEQIRQLIELQRQTEQERLQEAIKEAQKREEEERLRREEEQRLKLLKEETEKKAREEAERQKAELQERLKNEEKEREARRKRVEAIMLRTRGKNNANNLSSQSTDEKNENKSDEIKSKVNGTKIEQENGTTKMSKDIVDNLIPNEIVKNANTIDSMNTNDSINSNNAWRDNQQYGNFVLNNNS